MTFDHDNGTSAYIVRPTMGATVCQSNWAPPSLSVKLLIGARCSSARNAHHLGQDVPLPLRFFDLFCAPRAPLSARLRDRMPSIHWPLARVRACV